MIILFANFARFTFPIKKTTFWSTNIQNNKRQKKKPKHINWVLLFYYCYVQSFRLEVYNNASLHPLLFPFLDFLGHVIHFCKYLGRFNANIFQALWNFSFQSYILTRHKEGMSKTNSLKTFHHTQSFTIY
jgi:hypothetical protein